MTTCTECRIRIALLANGNRKHTSAPFLGVTFISGRNAMDVGKRGDPAPFSVVSMSYCSPNTDVG